MDPRDGLEVRLAATPGERPACDRREISQRASRSLAVALRIATRSGPVLVQEGVRPSLGLFPVVHGTGDRRLTVPPEDRARLLDLVRPNALTESIALALTMSVIVVLAVTQSLVAGHLLWSMPSRVRAPTPSNRQLSETAEHEPNKADEQHQADQRDARDDALHAARPTPRPGGCEQRGEKVPKEVHGQASAT